MWGHQLFNQPGIVRNTILGKIPFDLHDHAPGPGQVVINKTYRVDTIRTGRIKTALYILIHAAIGMMTLINIDS